MLLKSDVDVKNHLRGWFVNKLSCLAPALGVNKFVTINYMRSVTFVAVCKSDIDIIKPPKKLSSSFRCEQIHDNQ